MRIAVVSAVFPPYKGGIGHVAEAQTNALKALGHDVVVFEPSTTKSLFAYGNAALMPSLVMKLKGFDVIHVHYPCYGMDVFAVLASIIHKTPLVLTYHMKAVTKDWRNVIFTLHRWFIEPFIFLIAKKIFVSSLEYAEASGLSHDGLTEMPFGVDSTRFAPGVACSPSFKEGATGKSVVYLFVGGLDKAHDFKGVDILLRAFAKLAPSARLVIAGDGDLKAFYERLASDLMIADRVKFLGRVSDTELPNVYRSADVHVLPSINGGEAFGLVTLEAAASGLPSVVSDLPGVRTLVEKGRTGYLAKPGDVDDLAYQLQKFADRPEDAVIMGSAARVRVMERYDSGAIARQLLQAYNGVLKV
ncbi:MAG: glycosyltransferase family 4 protein [Patescibacteria group bacterium]|jgi:glycosyltransferase involved in cell wall biosynthesis